MADDPLCAVTGCDRPVFAVGMCGAHRRRVLRGAALDSPLKPATYSGRPPRPVPEGTRWCCVCLRAQPLEEFTGTSRACRHGKYLLHLRRTLGIEPEVYEQMMLSQGGLCAICRRRPAKYVDHCHRTLVVRGILCPPCNSALGAFGDDPAVFGRALEYLVGS